MTSELQPLRELVELFRRLVLAIDEPGDSPLMQRLAEMKSTWGQTKP